MQFRNAHAWLRGYSDREAGKQSLTRAEVTGIFGDGAYLSYERGYEAAGRFA